jgi:hypothetical protein
MKITDPSLQLLSTLTLHVQFTDCQIAALLDSYIIYAFDNRFSFVHDNYSVLLKKTDGIHIELLGNQVKIGVPMSIAVKRTVGITGWSGRSQLVISMVSDYSIDKGWQLTTTSRISQLEWLTPPTVFNRFFSLSLKWITRLFDSRLKDKIASSIDEYISGQSDLKNGVNQMMNLLNSMVQKHAIVNHSLDINISEVLLSQITQSDNLSSCIVSGRGNIRLLPTYIPLEPRRVIPSFLSKDKIEKTSAMILSAHLSDLQLSAWLNAHKTGYAFEVNGYQIVIKSYNLHFTDEQLIINLSFDGSLEGKIQAQIRPIYDNDSRKIKVTDIVIDVTSGSIILKSIIFLLKSKIKAQIVEVLESGLDAHKDYFESKINSILSQELAPFGLNPKIALTDLQIEGMQLSDDSCYLGLAARGEAGVTLINNTKLLNKMLI